MCSEIREGMKDQTKQDRNTTLAYLRRGGYIDETNFTDEKRDKSKVTEASQKEMKYCEAMVVYDKRAKWEQTCVQRVQR